MIRVALQLSRGEFSLDTNFSVPATGVTGIFGPSGCGKTTLLRAIAGLEPATIGHIEVGRAQWLQPGSALPVNERRVGFVFQNPSLFPHLSVIDNLLYARKRNKSAPYQYDLEHIIELLNLGNLLARNAGLLSGGERQRTAIGRALLASPAMLLMDEPLSAVDQAARNQLILTLEKVFQEIEIPVFYVSHSSEEIARLAESLVLMHQGRVIAHGELSQVLGEVNSPLSGSDESFSVLRCRVSSHELPFLTTVVSAGGAVIQLPRLELKVDTEVRLRIRARDVSITLQPAAGSSILNILPTTVTALAAAIAQGSRTVKLDLYGDGLLARVSEFSVQQLHLQENMQVFAQIKSVSLVG